MRWGTYLDDRQFRTNLVQMRRDIEREANAEATKIATRFERHLARNVPVDSGELKGTIENRSLASSGGEIKRHISIGNDQHDYAIPLEFGYNRGGAHVDGQRFFYPLAARYNKAWKAALRRAMKRVLLKFR